MDSNSHIDDALNRAMTNIRQSLLTVVAAAQKDVLDRVAVAAGTADTERASRGARVPRAAAVKEEPAAKRAAKKAKKAPKTSARALGEKRSPEALERLTQKLLAWVTKHPGKNKEELAKGLGVPSRELNLPTKRLLAGKQIQATGQKRATRYTAVA